MRRTESAAPGSPEAYASGTKPAGNTGWGQEISLEFEWAHAIAPQAKSYQKNLSYKRRANPDIAYDADPNTGFAVYDSYGGCNWNDIFGGTSAGAPQWSALLAIADQGRLAAGKSVLDAYSQTLPAIYAMTTGTTGTEQLNDVTSGKNSVGSAGPGFDLVTGLLTPRRSDLLYQALVNYQS
jgi:subtilase family serine protease